MELVNVNMSLDRATPVDQSCVLSVCPWILGSLVVLFSEGADPRQSLDLGVKPESSPAVRNLKLFPIGAVVHQHKQLEYRYIGIKGWQ